MNFSSIPLAILNLRIAHMGKNFRINNCCITVQYESVLYAGQIGQIGKGICYFALMGKEITLSVVSCVLFLKYKQYKHENYR